MLERIINDVYEWHKQTFPDADKESQLRKLEEELNEYYEKYDSSELADVIICSISLWRRFKCPIGHAVFVYATSIVSGPKANLIVSEKMKINLKRKWHNVDGIYRHDEGVKDE